jgi:hypothetical protein
MYEGDSTSVRTLGRATNNFPITIGLHQGSTLCCYLFTLVSDVPTEHIQELALRYMLFVDDIVLLRESREELNGWLKKSLRSVRLLPE